jgi:hypothetical protein
MIRRTPLRRTRPKPWFRAEEDKVTPEQAAATFARDRACVLWLMDPTHECADRFGHPHAADDLRRMTIEHVKEHSATGVRGKWLVTMCGMGNVSVPSRVQREWIRDYYRRVEG